jgi:hypothetical protein
MKTKLYRQTTQEVHKKDLQVLTLEVTFLINLMFQLKM